MLNPSESKLLLSLVAGAGVAQQGSVAVDWEALEGLASEHKLTALVYPALRRLPSGAVPQEVLENFREGFHHNAQRSLFYAAQMIRLAQAFQRAKIPFVAYKGPTLALTVYGDLGAREFVDLDILIHQWDLPKVEQLLASQGYRLWTRVPLGREEAYLKSYALCNNEFDHWQGELQLDIHWQVAPRWFISGRYSEELWERLEDVSVGGVVLKAFEPEDILLILCIHSTKHHWACFGWVHDVAQLLRKYQSLRWDLVTERSKRFGCQRMLLLGLFLARDLLQVDLPQKLEELIRQDPSVEALARAVQRQWQRMAGASTSMKQWTWFLLTVRERLRDRARFLLWLAVSPSGSDWEALPLPIWFFPIYFVLRPIRLAGKYGAILWRFLWVRTRSSGAEAGI